MGPLSPRSQMLGKLSIWIHHWGLVLVRTCISKSWRLRSPHRAHCHGHGQRTGNISNWNWSDRSARIAYRLLNHLSLMNDTSSCSWLFLSILLGSVVMFGGKKKETRYRLVVYLSLYSRTTMRSMHQIYLNTTTAVEDRCHRARRRVAVEETRQRRLKQHNNKNHPRRAVLVTLIQRRHHHHSMLPLSLSF